MTTKIENKNYSEAVLNNYLNEFTGSYNNNPAVPRLTISELAGMIDHTLLKPEASRSEIEDLCREAVEYNFASVCVNSSYVKTCWNVVKDTSVKVCSVIGFPLGASGAEIKVRETEYALLKGASEVDMVMNIGALRSKDYNFVYQDIRAVVNTAHSKSALCKVIIETCLLDDNEKIAACLLVKDAGADFIKTSTGFSKGGAVAKDVALMKFIAGDNCKVKASGGIKTAEDALAMIASGASRIGTSSGVKIIESYKQSNLDH